MLAKVFIGAFAALRALIIINAHALIKDTKLRGWCSSFCIKHLATVPNVSQSKQTWPAIAQTRE